MGWDILFSEIRHAKKREYEIETKKSFLIRRKVDILGSVIVNSTDTAMGEKRLKRFEWILEHGFEWKRHYFERIFHAKAVMALAQTIMGNDWETKGMDVARDRKWTNISQFVCAMAPRRFGKSAAVAKIIIAVAEVLLLMPDGLPYNDFPIAVFSTGKRASQSLAEYVIAFIKQRSLGNYIYKKNSEEIILYRNDGHEMKVSMKFLPSNPDR